MTSPQSETSDIAQKVISLYQNLDSKYQVRTNFTVGLGHPKQGPEINLAQDVQILLFHLNSKTLNPTDFDQRSLINIVVYKKSGEFLDAFAQDTNTYMEAFDKTSLTEFLTKYAQ